LALPLWRSRYFPEWDLCFQLTGRIIAHLKNRMAFMKLVSFDLFRTLGLPGVSFIKPEDFHNHPDKHLAAVSAADWVLFPAYWQLNALIYGLGCRVFPSEATYRIGHNKIEMTRVCQLLTPKNLPGTWIRPNTAEDAAAIWELMQLPFVAKIPKAAQGNGVWLIENLQDWKTYLGRTATLYVQEYLPIDRDLRLVVVGSQVLAAYWRRQSDRGFHTNLSRGGWPEYDNIPVAAVDYVLSLSRTLGIDHAGFDIAMVGDRPYLLEFNRLFGNQGIGGGGRTLNAAMLKYLIEHNDGHRPLHPDRPRDLSIAV
jgi:ribosomal protein S6--L-glutamate ligase